MAEVEAWAGKIRAARGHVEWVMTPDDARDLADFIEETTTSKDLARRDAAALRRAADELEPSDG